MTLSTKQQEEIELATKDAVRQTLRVERFVKWIPTLLSVFMLVGATYVAMYRLGQAEDAIKEKANKEELSHVVEETDLKLKVIKKDVDHIKEGNQRIERTQEAILEEVRDLNRHN